MVLKITRSQKTEIENKRIRSIFLSHVPEFERKMAFCFDLSANVFQWSTQKTRLFLIFFSSSFCSIIHLFEKSKLKLRSRANSCLPSKDNLDYFMFSGRISKNIGENIFRFYTGTTSQNTDFHVIVA